MKLYQVIPFTIFFIFLLSCESLSEHVSYIHPTVSLKPVWHRMVNTDPSADDLKSVPSNCDDGGLKFSLSLSAATVHPDNFGGPPLLGNTTAKNIIATITLHNANPYPVVVCWINSPLDYLAEAIGGIFRLYSIATGDRIPIIQDVQFNRNFPTPQSGEERLLADEIKVVRQELELMTSALSELVDGRYMLRVEGYWGYILAQTRESEYFKYCFISPGVEIEVRRLPSAVKSHTLVSADHD